MDPFFRELCIEIINQDVASDKFASLLVETGVRLECHEWNMANKLLEKGDEINAHLKYTQGSLQ